MQWLRRDYHNAQGVTPFLTLRYILRGDFMKPVKLSKDIDKLNRPVQQKQEEKKRVEVRRKVVKPVRRRKRRDYDDILDEFWL